jgi:hypothetical protein
MGAFATDALVFTTDRLILSHKPNLVKIQCWKKIDHHR